MGELSVPSKNLSINIMILLKEILNRFTLNLESKEI